MAVVFELDALFGQERGLLIPTGYKTTCGVYDAMAGILAVELRLLEHLAHKARVFRASDESGNLPVSRDAPRGNFGNGLENLIDKVIVEHMTVA